MQVTLLDFFPVFYYVSSTVHGLVCASTLAHLWHIVLRWIHRSASCVKFLQFDCCGNERAPLVGWLALTIIPFVHQQVLPFIGNILHWQFLRKEKPESRSSNTFSTQQTLQSVGLVKWCLTCQDQIEVQDRQWIGRYYEICAWMDPHKLSYLVTQSPSKAVTKREKGEGIEEGFA